MSGDTLLALTDRDRRVLVEVTRFGAISREQLMRLGLFGSKTRANERLHKLVLHGYLVAKRQALDAGGPRLIYLPGPEIRDTQIVRKRFTEASELFLSHQLGLVDIRLAFEQGVPVKRWLADREFAGAAPGVIPDAYVEFERTDGVFCCFIEYDRGTETLARIERKVRAYLDLAYSGRFERTFTRRFFRLAFVLESPRRLNTVSATVARVTDRIVRLALLSELIEKGPLGSIWRRPGKELPESLSN